MPAPTVLLVSRLIRDEAAGLAVGRVRIERDRPVERDVADADLVHLEHLGGKVLHRVDVDLVLRLGDGWRSPSACRSSSGTAARAACARRSSRRCSPRTGRRLRPARSRPEITSAARDVDLVFERQRHRLAGHRHRLIAGQRDDRLDAALAPRRLRAHAVARLDAATRDQFPQKPRKSRFGPVQPTAPASGTHRSAGATRRCPPSRGRPSGSGRDTRACSRSARSCCRRAGPRAGSA